VKSYVGRPWKLEVDGQLLKHYAYATRDSALRHARDEARQRKCPITVIDMSNGVENERIEVP
jgi:hypothetical protein